MSQKNKITETLVFCIKVFTNIYHRCLYIVIFFMRRLKRELEFTELQENCSSASNHGSTNLKWEESDTDSFLTPRDRPANKQDGDSVWHLRGSSGELINAPYRPVANNTRLSSPPLPDSSRLNYLSRIPAFHSSSYESVNVDHPARSSTESQSLNTQSAGGTQASRVQSNHSFISTGVTKPTRLSTALCRTSDISNTGRLPSSNSESSEIPYSVRSHSNGSACDNINVRGHPHRESFIGRVNKAQPQTNRSTRKHSSNTDAAPNNLNKIYAHLDPSKTQGNLIETSKISSSNHTSRITSNLSDTCSLAGKVHNNNHKESSVHSNRMHSNREPSNHVGRVHSSPSDSTSHMNRVNSSLCDSGSLTNKLHSSHGEIVNHPSRVLPNHDSPTHPNRKVANYHEPTVHSARSINSHNDSSSHANRINGNHGDSTRYLNHTESSGHSNRPHVNYNDATVHSGRPLSNLNEASAGHPSRPHSNHSDSSGHSNKTHSSDSSVHSIRGHSVHSDTHCHTNKVHCSQNELSNLVQSGRHSNNNESTSSNHADRTRPNQSDPVVSSNSSRVYASHGPSSESINSVRSLSSHSPSSEAASQDASSRLSVQSSSSESSITNHSSRLQTGHGSTNSEAANIARSSRVPPPQRHLSQSVLYLSADHRKLFPISTYQPEPPR